jgi:hypothetical protein
MRARKFHFQRESAICEPNDHNSDGAEYQSANRALSEIKINRVRDYVTRAVNGESSSGGNLGCGASSQNDRDNICFLPTLRQDSSTRGEPYVLLTAFCRR